MKRIALLCVFMLMLMGKAAAGEDAPAWMEKFQPAKEHEALKKLEGSYDVLIKMWMDPDPAKPPQESKGAAEFKMVLGGRWLRQDFKGEMMGKPYIGVGTEGFDRVTGKYVSAWIDDFSTQMMHSAGTSKDGGKTIEITGEQADPAVEGKIIKFRLVHKEVSADSFVFEMYETHDGKEVKGMEMVYTRKK